MKNQKIIIYLLTVFTLAGVSTYLCCTFQWNMSANIVSSPQYMFISNISLGIFCSAFISIIIALITYFSEKAKLLDDYFWTFKKLFDLSSKFPKGYQFKEKEDWFNNYKELCIDLNHITSQLSFLFDISFHAKYLRQVTTYYMDFILLTQSSFLFLERFTQDMDDSKRKELCDYIDSIVIETETVNHGILKMTTEFIKLTHHKELVMKYVDEIAKCSLFNIFKRYHFTQTLITKENFILLDKDTENYVKKIIKETHKTNSNTVVLDMPTDVCEILLQNKYLYSYSILSGEKKKLQIDFILNHYFDLKTRLYTLSSDDINLAAEITFPTLYSSMVFISSFLILVLQMLKLENKVFNNSIHIFILVLGIIVILSTHSMIRCYAMKNDHVLSIITFLEKANIYLVSVSMLMCLLSSCTALGIISTPFSRILLISIIILTLFAVYYANKNR